MAYVALYRKYRPTTFEEVVGQEHIEKTLKNQIKNNRIGHAYLFSGGRGSGKTSTAKILARAVNCLNPKDGNPCNECENCKKALSGNLIDILEMDAASNNGVDNIRDIREEVEFIPTSAKYKVYIIDEVHMLSIGAFNALLKTLEEPPEHVIFILATTEPHKIPNTILSRCQRFDFKRISVDNIIKRLKYICDSSNIQIEENAIRLIANLADGAMRDAISILDRCVSDGDEIITEEKIRILSGVPNFEYLYNMTEYILENDVTNILSLTQVLINEGKDLNLFVWELIKFQRDISIIYTTGESDIYSNEEFNSIINLTKKYPKEVFLSLISSLSDVQNNMKWSMEPSVMFEVGLIKICSNALNVQPNLKTNTISVLNKEKSDDSKHNIETISTNDITNQIMDYLKSNVRMRLHTSLLGTNIEIMDDGIVHIKFSSPVNNAVLEYLQNIDTKQIIKQVIKDVLGKEYPVKYDFFK